MANVLPPSRPAGTPILKTLIAGMILFRVHSKNFPPDEPNPSVSHKYYGGGRFDATADDAYAFLYAGETVQVALAETLLRDLPTDLTGPRILPKAFKAGKRISAIQINTDVTILGLATGRELGQVSQDTWLTTCPAREYAQSRHWGHTIRSWVPTAQGFAWLSHRDPQFQAFVFFSDRISPGILQRCSHPSLPVGPAADFDSPHGVRWLRQQLAAYGVTIARR